MKKQLTLLLTLMLVFTFVLSACGKASEPTEDGNTVNLPVVDGGDDQTTESTLAPADAYPVEEPANDAALAYPADAALAYPVDPSSPTYDADMEAYLTALLDGNHSVESLLEKDFTAEQWRGILLNATHSHLTLSEGALQAIIDWLMSK